MRHRALVQDMLDVGAPLLLVDHAKQHINLLQTAALGLLHEEENEDAHGQTEDAEHEEGAPADVVHGGGGHLGDDEVEEPLRGSAEADAVGAEAGREDLGGC